MFFMRPENSILVDHFASEDGLSKDLLDNKPACRDDALKYLISYNTFPAYQRFKTNWKSRNDVNQNN